MERRQVRPVGPEQGRHHDGVPTRNDIPYPLRAGRRLHGLRRVLLLIPGRHRPQPLSHVDGMDRQRRCRRRAGARQLRGRLRLVHLSRTTGARRRELEDLPGCRRRAGRRPLLGLGRPVCRQLWRQLAPLFSPVPKCPAGQPVARTSRHRYEHLARRHAVRPVQAGRAHQQPAAGILGGGTRGLYRTPELAGELRRLVRVANPGCADRQPGPSGARPPSS